MDSAMRIIERIEPQVDEKISLGEIFAQLSGPPNLADLFAEISGPSTLLTDIDVLFTPALRLDPTAQLRKTAHCPWMEQYDHRTVELRAIWGTRKT